jgi:hypothetical protein
MTLEPGLDGEDKSADSYDARAAVGRRVIRGSWAALRQPAKDALIAEGYSVRGDPPVSTEDFDVGLIPIEYTLGLLKEAALTKTPSKLGDWIPAVLNGDEVLNVANDLVSDLRWRDPVLARLALIALISQQTAGALSFLAFRGGDPDSSGLSLRRSWPALLVGALFGLIYGVVFAGCTGYGLAYALHSDGWHASICAFFASGAVSAMVQMTRQLRENFPVAKSPERIAYDAWRSLNLERSTIGSGHGLDAKLRRMMTQGIAVPNVLIDLCAILGRP